MGEIGVDDGGGEEEGVALVEICDVVRVAPPLLEQFVAQLNSTVVDIEGRGFEEMSGRVGGIGVGSGGLELVEGVDEEEEQVAAVGRAEDCPFRVELKRDLLRGVRRFECA